MPKWKPRKHPSAKCLMNKVASAAADAHFLRLALQQAQLAQAAGEVPVGAVLVHQGQVIATGHNLVIAQHDPSAHAEIVALRRAGQYLGNYRLQDCELFVTLEPCAMCAGAIAHARLARVVYGVRDARAGAAGSVLNVLQTSGISHQPQALCAQDKVGFDAAEGSTLLADLQQLLPDFFQAKRQPKAWPLRPDAVRSPEAGFAHCPQTTASRYTQALPALAGLRMHYWDNLAAGEAEPADGRRSYLCLHDGQGWSQDFADFFAQHSAAARVLIPDLPGFGRSDKPKKWPAHTAAAYWLQVLAAFVQELAPQAMQAGRLQLVLSGQSHPLAAALQQALALSLPPLLIALPRQRPWRDAPYPDAGHRAAQRAWEQKFPSISDKNRVKPA